MPTRIIQRPADITVEPPAGAPQTISFSEFVQQLLNQPIWASDYKHVRMARAIDDALAGVGDVVLAEEDWKALKEVAEKPPAEVGYGYHPWVMRSLLPFLDAIVRAEVRKPAAAE